MLLIIVMMMRMVGKLLGLLTLMILDDGHYSEMVLEMMMMKRMSAMTRKI